VSLEDLRAEAFRRRSEAVEHDEPAHTLRVERRGVRSETAAAATAKSFLFISHLLVFNIASSSRTGH
jgi:hypothetical protein